jgi:hypothetical protein
MTTSAPAGLSSRTTYSEATDWDTYTSEDNGAYLEEIFGDPDSGAATVSKIRVLLEQYAASVENIVTMDPDFTCEVSEEFSGSDTIDVAFFGTVSNGTEGHRYYSCVYQDDGEAALYGSADGVVRFIQMQHGTSTNTEEVETRGDEMTLSQVVMVAYAQEEVDSITTAYLDLQYAQATIYEGADGDVLETDDNILFKSRSRITGTTVLSADGAISSPAGDFTITKYDKSLTPEDQPYTSTIQIHGRGDLTESAYFLLSVTGINADLPGETQTFCLSSTSLLPDAAESTNCTTYETAYAWGSTTFPFTLDPAIPATYDGISFFENDATGMIADDASNFEIPTY